MTAEDLYEKQTGNKAYGYANIPSVEYVEWLENKYPIHIAEKAVDEYKKESLTGTWFAPSITCDEILSRIKTLTEE